MNLTDVYFTIAAVPDGSWEFSNVSSGKLSGNPSFPTNTSPHQEVGHGDRGGIEAGSSSVRMRSDGHQSWWCHQWARIYELQFVKGNYVCQPYAHCFCCKKCPIFILVVVGRCHVSRLEKVVGVLLVEASSVEKLDRCRWVRPKLSQGTPG